MVLSDFGGKIFFGGKKLCSCLFLALKDNDIFGGKMVVVYFWHLKTTTFFAGNWWLCQILVGKKLWR